MNLLLVKIVQVLPEDLNGGAFRVPLYLHEEYSRFGFESKMLVGEKHTNWDFVIRIPNYEMRSSWARLFYKIERKIPSFRGSWRVKELIRFIGQPLRQTKVWFGFEDFEFPGTRFVIDFLKKERPDVLNAHVLHGFWLSDRGFFDLRMLPHITRVVPVVLTLHDMWLMTGHCSFSFGCDRWETGCGSCPDITLPPAIRRDMSHINWLTKKKIYQKSEFWCIAPAKWIADMAQRSVLRYGMKGIKVIYNAVDHRVFRPVSPDGKMRLRKELGLPENKFTIISAGKSLRTSKRKGFDILLDSIKLLSHREDILVIALGGAGVWEERWSEKIGNISLLYLPFVNDHAIVAKYFSASDVFLMTSRAETFPLVVIEASACGAVPVASDVGGVREFIEDGKNGFIVKPEDYGEFARIIDMLSEDRYMLETIRAKAIENSKRFRIDIQAKQCIEFFHQIIDEFRTKRKNI